MRQASTYGAIVMSMALMVAIASFFVFPVLTTPSFGPIHIKDEVDFSALRATAQPMARNDNKHLRDADRDEGKGGTPPDNTPFLVVAVVDPGMVSLSVSTHWPLSAVQGMAFSRGNKQPRAPPADFS